MKPLEDLYPVLDVLQTADITNYHKLYDVGKEIVLTDKAVQLELRSIGRTEWIPLSIMRIGSENSIWLQSWKFNKLYGV